MSTDCAECGLKESTYCERCRVHFCDSHYTTHIKTIRCEKCNIDQCEEFFENSTICFKCSTFNQLSQIKQEANKMYTSARRAPLPKDIHGVRQNLDLRNQTRQFEKILDEFKLILINRFG